MISPRAFWGVLTGLAGVLLGWLVVGAYYAWLWARNNGKTRAHLSSCLIGVIEHLFNRDVDLADVEIVVNASGIAKAKAVTKGHTIYWKGDFDEDADMALLLHELHHTQQYSDWGYAAFATRYAQEAAYYLSHDSMPIEIAADAFRDANIEQSRTDHGHQCKGLPKPGDGILEEETRRPSDWTMILGLT